MHSNAVLHQAVTCIDGITCQRCIHVGVHVYRCIYAVRNLECHATAASHCIRIGHKCIRKNVHLYQRYAALCCAVLCCAVLCCAVLCCAVLRCAVLCCAVLCCAVLCCAVLCSAALCSAAQLPVLTSAHNRMFGDIAMVGFPEKARNKCVLAPDVLMLLWCSNLL